MAETREQRAKRLAEALRENLKRRKQQQRGLGVAGAGPVEETGDRVGEGARRFRQKPLTPDAPGVDNACADPPSDSLAKRPK